MQYLQNTVFDIINCNQVAINQLGQFQLFHHIFFQQSAIRQTRGRPGPHRSLGTTAPPLPRDPIHPRGTPPQVPPRNPGPPRGTLTAPIFPNRVPSARYRLTSSSEYVPSRWPPLSTWISISYSHSHHHQDCENGDESLAPYINKLEKIIGYFAVF